MKGSHFTIPSCNLSGFCAKPWTRLIAGHLLLQTASQMEFDNLPDFARTSHVIALRKLYTPKINWKSIKRADNTRAWYSQEGRVYWLCFVHFVLLWNPCLSSEISCFPFYSYETSYLNVAYYPSPSLQSLSVVGRVDIYRSYDLKTFAVCFQFESDWYCMSSLKMSSSKVSRSPDKDIR